MNEKSILLTLLFTALPLAADFMLYPPHKDNCGINSYSADDDTWRAEMIYNSGFHDYADFKEVGTEFFQHEYGIPLNFSRNDDPLKTIGAEVCGNYKIINSALQIASDFSFTIGKNPKNQTADSICFGEHWNNESLPRLFLLLDIDQDCKESSWEFTKYE